jgi:hypothetical protein
MVRTEGQISCVSLTRNNQSGGGTFGTLGLARAGFFGAVPQLLGS